MRVHVAYTVVKSLIQCTQQAGIPLETTTGTTLSRIRTDKNQKFSIKLRGYFKPLNYFT